MANQQQLDILRQGIDVWNMWRKKHPNVPLNLNRAQLSNVDLRDGDFSETDLRGAHLNKAHLSGANFSKARLAWAHLRGADLTRAILSGADLNRANLHRANLSEGTLNEAHLSGADLSRAKLNRVNLSGADLTWATLSEAEFREANLTGCRVYAISAWNVFLDQTIQSNLIITPKNEPTITVDNLEVAQFIYLLLNSPKIRQTIDTINSQVVLILGSFPPERKEVIDALSAKLRSQKYSPVVFNVEGAENKDVTAPVRTLANMARFVLLDLTGLGDTAREIAHAIVPHCVIPIRPLLLQGSPGQGYELFRGLQHKYQWVLAPYRYTALSDLQTSFQEKILQPINEKMIALKQKNPLKMFIGYAPEDKNMLNELKRHLRPVERAGLIEVWDDQDIAPGEEKGKEVERHFFDARIILLLLSPAFLDSDDCYDQMSMAIERYEQAEASVIPILLRPYAWQSTPLKDLQPLPKDGEPISQQNKDDVFFEVSEEIAEVIKILR